jgi:hypothetical protein
MASVSDQTIKDITRSCFYFSEDNLFMETVKKLSTTQFDTDLMEDVYRLKDEYIKKVPVFKVGFELKYISARMEVLNDSLFNR